MHKDLSRVPDLRMMSFNQIDDGNPENDHSFGLGLGYIVRFKWLLKQTNERRAMCEALWRVSDPFKLLQAMSDARSFIKGSGSPDETFKLLLKQTAATSIRKVLTAYLEFIPPFSLFLELENLIS